MTSRVLTHAVSLGLCFCFALPAMAQADLPAVPEVVRIPAGEQATIVVPDSSGAAIDDGSVVTMQASGKSHLTLTGVKEGRTTLVFMDEKGGKRDVDVIVTPQLTGVAREIDNLLDGIPNARVFPVADRVIIDGKLLSLEDLERVKKIAAAFSDVVVNLAVFDSGPSNEVIAEFIRRVAGVETVKINLVGQTAFISGFVFGDNQRSNVLNLARTQVANVVDMLSVRDVMIETEIMFLKVTKSSGFDIGVNLLDGGQGLVMKGGVEGQQTRKDADYSAMDVTLTWSAQIAPQLKVLMNDGNATILAHPRLCTKNNEIGKFLSGGEYYYEVSGVQAADMKNVEYGVQLEVKPTFVSENEILNTMKITVSIPTAKSGSEQLNLDKFETACTVVCQVGQSIVLSGLLENLKNFYKSRTPLIGDLPVLDWFFGSSSRQDEDTQLLAIVTPRILTPLTPEQFKARAPEPVSKDVQPRVDAYVEEMRTGVYTPPAAPHSGGAVKSGKRPKSYRIW